VTAPGKKAARKAAAAAALGESDADQALFRALRVRRSALAKAQAVPAYVILPDRSLLDMARRKPSTLDEMAGVHGVGDVKLKRYGDEFLEVIRQHEAGE
jgi:ATP-dependent DNA helicase RecQ